MFFPYDKLQTSETLETPAPTRTESLGDECGPDEARKLWEEEAVCAKENNKKRQVINICCNCTRANNLDQFGLNLAWICPSVEL